MYSNPSIYTFSPIFAGFETFSSRKSLKLLPIEIPTVYITLH